MMKLGRLSLLAACLVAFAPAAMADDAALAARLVGSWEGRWEFGEAGGKLTARVTASSGNTLKGETKWFGTAVGDFSDRFSSARLKDGKLKVSEQTMDFEVIVAEDGSSMTGTWTSPGGSGPMSLKKKAD